VIVFARAAIASLALFVTGILLATAGPAARAAAVDPELRGLYRQILRNPKDAALNLRYAALAERKGLLRKALAAYQRVLIQDPRNAEARAGLRRIAARLEPDFTAVYLQLGVRYATNVRLRTDRFNEDEDDVIGDGRLIVNDERRLWGRRWRTAGQLYADLHAKFHDLDFGYLGASTGPLIDLPGDWRLRPAVGAAFAWLDRKVLFGEFSGQLNFEAVGAGLLRRVDIRFAYQLIGSDFATDRHGFVVEVSPQFARANLLRQGDALTVQPRYRLNGASGRNANPALVQGDIFPERYHQFGGDVRYIIPVAGGRILVGPIFRGNVRFYRSNKPGSSTRRRDVFIRPGAQLVVPNAFRKGHTLVFRYQYEQNLSNSRIKNFRNHVFGVRSVWRLY
jgi:hypothetical protein